MKTLHLLGLVLAMCLLGGLPAQTQSVDNFRPLTQEVLNNPDPADWLMWRRTYEHWGYSPLDQIDRANVGELQFAWAYSLSPGRMQQAEPLVYDGVMYLRHPDELVTALDGRTGDLIWQYRRRLPSDIEDYGGITLNRGRGMFIYGDRLINHSSDGWLYALDPRTGTLIWEVQLADYRRQEQPSGAPVVYEGVIAVPYNCTAGAVVDPCHLSAYSAEDGRLLWRWFTTTTRDDPNNVTWGPDPDRYALEVRRNNSPWMTPAVDVEGELFIFGVGSSAPMQPELVGSDGQWPDRLYHGSTVALDIHTGQLVWWAQHQSDMHNNDSVHDRILVDSPVDPSATDAPWLGRSLDTRPNEPRRLVVGSFSKDGIFYAYDRTNGQFLYARETAPQNIINGYDGETGAYILNPETRMTGDETRVVSVCRDARNVPPGAYSPLTNAYYAPIWSACADIRTISPTPGIAEGYNIATVRSYQNPDSPTFGRPEAISVATGATLWRLDRDAPLYGMLTTAGGLLFAADTNRRFYALDQWTGEILWQTILSGLSDQAPISYAVDGRQYVAIASPGGSQSGSGGHATRLGLRIPQDGHTIFVFALPER